MTAGRDRPRADDLPEIRSPANPVVKAVVALRRRRIRDERGVTLVEGLDELRMALDGGARPVELYLCPELLPDRGIDVERVRADVQGVGARVVRLSRAAFEKASYRDGPDGVLAVVPAPGTPLTHLRVADPALVVVCQGVEKPGNLGAVLRTADAAGAGAMLSADPVTDWGNPNVVRASKGTVYAVPVATATTAEVTTWLDRHGIPLVVATPAGSVEYVNVDYRGPVALAVGSERAGADEALLAAAHHRVRIPMAGRIDSLNVAASAAIVLFEAVRQRRLS